MTHKAVNPEDLTKARADGFLSGYIVCLTNMNGVKLL